MECTFRITKRNFHIMGWSSLSINFSILNDDFIACHTLPSPMLLFQALP